MCNAFENVGAAVFSSNGFSHIVIPLRLFCPHTDRGNSSMSTSLAFLLRLQRLHLCHMDYGWSDWLCLSMFVFLVSSLFCVVVVVVVKTWLLLGIVCALYITRPDPVRFCDSD